MFQNFIYLLFTYFKAINEWEKATKLIVEREKHIFELENFERFASDPNRYFLRGHRGSSVARLEEAQQRDIIYKVCLYVLFEKACYFYSTLFNF